MSLPCFIRWQGDVLGPFIDEKLMIDELMRRSREFEAKGGDVQTSMADGSLKVERLYVSPTEFIVPETPEGHCNG
ncbi:MAG TPA: hypothetical protein VGG63_16430 [Steroidobacteraceae bacterium]|jgi:hypothetical protein